MTELKVNIPTTSLSNTIITSNAVTAPDFGRSSSSMSFTIESISAFMTIEELPTHVIMAESPSKPLSAGAIRVVNSVLRAKVSEASFRRDVNGEI
jgi:hypothetical protein